MDFTRSEIQTMLLDSAERVLSETAGVEHWRERRRWPFGFDEARWTQFAELGWLALPMPEAAGGLGGGIEDVALLNVALGGALATEPYVSSVVLAGHILAEALDAASANQLLGAIASGALRIALAHHEQGGDPLITGAEVAARAEGAGFVLDGVKIMALDAPSAGRLIVSARIADEDGLGLFLVPVDAAGVAVAGYPLVDGTHAGDVTFSGVALPGSALLAGAGRGSAVLREAIDRASIALMAQAVGAIEASVTICGAYAAERRQFGVAIGSFQAIQHILADMFVAAHQARSMLYHAIANAHRPDAERASALSAARIVIGEAGQSVSRNGIQVHGGYGLTDEYPISHYFRRLMALEKQYGDIDAHVERLGAGIFTSASSS